MPTDAITRYLSDIENLQTESARSHRFAQLLQELFGTELGFIEQYAQGIEQIVRTRHKDRLLRGQVDNLFGNLVIEFEADLERKRAEAEAQLAKYVQILWAEEPDERKTPYLCLATDGVRFAVYTPIALTPSPVSAQNGTSPPSPLSVNGEGESGALRKADGSPSPFTERGLGGEVQLISLETLDWHALPPDAIYLWLDRILLRRERLLPTSELIVREFGLHSHAYRTLSQRMLAFWQRHAHQPHYAVLYDGWAKYLSIVYGAPPNDPELFIRHTYLATLAKLMAWQRLNQYGHGGVGGALYGHGSVGGALYGHGGVGGALYGHDGVGGALYGHGGVGGALYGHGGAVPLLLNGKLFQEQGVHGYIEDDFFAWLARPDAQTLGTEVATRLSQLLHAYDLSRLNEDVLKSLYQELVDPDTRHDLGEYYTPDWLAHRIVQELLAPDPQRSLLDPACGSGTFLYFAILEKRARLGDSPDTLRHILQSVCGADIHPLAVLIARTNYLLALGELLHHRTDALHLPVYLADTLRLPEYERLPIAGQPTLRYRLELDGAEVFLPEAFLSDPALYDRLIELAREVAETHAHRPLPDAQLRNFLHARGLLWGELSEEFEAFRALARILKGLMEQGRDTIWAFILKNLYRPLFLRERFDALMGNPPWIAFRFLEGRYQAFLRPLIVGGYGLTSGRGELITHLEIATLFLLRAADLYLKAGGQVGFVMPRSLFHADQHDALRRGAYRLMERPHAQLRLGGLWDCERVEPLFSVPCCVVWAELTSPPSPVSAQNGTSPPSPLSVNGEGESGALRKADGSPSPFTERGLGGEVISAKLPHKNAALQEALHSLRVEQARFYLHTRGKRSYWSLEPPAHADAPTANPYRERFRQGATLVPRTFWFVQLQPTPLGYNPQLPPVRTYAPSKAGPVDRYKNLSYEGTVEAQFLYATLLGDDVLPFGYRNVRMVLLPILPTANGYELLTAETAREQGYLRLAQWLERAESEWNRLRERKADKASVYEWLNYRGKLTEQSPTARYRVVYPDVNRVMVACVVECETQAPLNGVILESTCYYCATDDEDEAYYLCALLNASVIDEKLGGLRRREQRTHPHVAKKIFDVAVLPLYDGGDGRHRALAALGRACALKVREALASGVLDARLEVGVLRRRVRELLAEELREVDGIAREVVG